MPGNERLARPLDVWGDYHLERPENFWIDQQVADWFPRAHQFFADPRGSAYARRLVLGRIAWDELGRLDQALAAPPLSPDDDYRPPSIPDQVEADLIYAIVNAVLGRPANQDDPKQPLDSKPAGGLDRCQPDGGLV